MEVLALICGVLSLVVGVVVLIVVVLQGSANKRVETQLATLGFRGELETNNLM